MKTTLAFLVAAAAFPFAARAASFSSPAPDASFQRRLDMIEALERSKDDARLNELIVADEGLVEYETVLRRAATYLKDEALVRKLLDAPALDQTSDAYKRAVGDVYGYGAANDRDALADGPIAAMLLERFKDDGKAVQAQLDFTLSTLSGPYPFTPNVKMTRALVEAGGDLDAALSKARAQIELRYLSNPDTRRYLVERLEAWVRRYGT